MDKWLNKQQESLDFLKKEGEKIGSRSILKKIEECQNIINEAVKISDKTDHIIKIGVLLCEIRHLFR